MSLNLARRHLNSSQCAFVALEVERVLAEEAKDRQIVALKQGNATKHSESSIGEKIPQSTELSSKAREPKATELAAGIVGNTNARYVQDAKKIEREAPEVKELVMAGTVNMADAVKLTKLEPDKRAVAVERRVYLYGRLPRAARFALRGLGLLSSRQKENFLSTKVKPAFCSSVTESLCISSSIAVSIASPSALYPFIILCNPVR